MKNIVIIGIDGAGKSTQSAMLKKAFKEKNISSSVVKGDGANCCVFDEIEKYEQKVIESRTRLLGYALDFSYRHIELKKHSNNKTVFIWDRYTYCLTAYFLALGVDIDEASIILSILPKPDITLLLDIDAEYALKRLNEGRKKIKPEENIDYLSKVRLQYLELAKKNNIKIINALDTVENIHNKIWEVVGENSILQWKENGYGSK